MPLQGGPGRAGAAVQAADRPEPTAGAGGGPRGGAEAGNGVLPLHDPRDVRENAGFSRRQVPASPGLAHWPRGSNFFRGCSFFQFFLGHVFAVVLYLNFTLVFLKMCL